MQPGETQTLEQLPTPVPDVPVAPQPNRLQWVFLGPNGLRAFWRLIIFVAIVAGMRFAISGILRLLHLVRPHPAVIDFSAKTVLIQDGLAFLCVLLATLVMGAFEKRSLGDYGLPARGAFGLRFFEGIVWGFVAECATMFTLFHGECDVSRVCVDRRSRAPVCAVVGCRISYGGTVRGMPVPRLPAIYIGDGNWLLAAALVLSALFWREHMNNPGENWVGGVGVALAAILFAFRCGSREICGSRSACTPHGTGRKLSFLVLPIVACPPTGTCSIPPFQVPSG